MTNDPNVHVTEITDAEGVVWEAHQRVGSGASVGHSEAMSEVIFNNLKTGEKLRGRVIGIGEAPVEELKASLKEAKRVKGVDTPEEHGR